MSDTMNKHFEEVRVKVLNEPCCGNCLHWDRQDTLVERPFMKHVESHKCFHPLHEDWEEDFSTRKQDSCKDGCWEPHPMGPLPESCLRCIHFVENHSVPCLYNERAKTERVHVPSRLRRCCYNLDEFKDRGEARREFPDAWSRAFLQKYKELYEQGSYSSGTRMRHSEMFADAMISRIVESSEFYELERRMGR